MKRLLLLFVCITVLSCSDSETEVSSDVTKLEQFINLPAKPLSVQWTYWNSGGGDFISLGPTDYSITAVIKFNESDFKKLKKKYKTEESHYDDKAKDFVKNWFPQSVKDCIVNKGDHVSVILWKNPKEFTTSPLVNGYCFFTNNNEVFVHMYTM